jgi:DNA polymerase III delta subunit
MYLSQLAQHLQKDRLKPVYVAFGNNPFEIQEVVCAFRARAAGDIEPIVALTEFGKDERNLPAVMDALQGTPMFAEYSLVVLQDADEFISRSRKPLEHYLEHPSPSGVLVLTVNRWDRKTILAKKVEKLGGDIACWAPRSRGDVLTWIQRRAKAVYRKTIASAAAELLAELCQDDLGALAAELGKLDLYVGQATQISESDVTAAAMGYQSFKPFDICDRLATGDSRAALEVAESLMEEGLPAVVLIGTLRSHYRRLLEARLAADTAGVSAAVSQFARFPKEQDSFRRQLETFSSDAIVNAYRQLLKADLHSKTSRYPERLVVERLLQALASPGRVAGN